MYSYKMGDQTYPPNNMSPYNMKRTHCSMTQQYIKKLQNGEKVLLLLSRLAI